MNKTQLLLLERLEGKHGGGNIKEKWGKYGSAIRLQKLSEIDQAYKLAEKYPDKFKTATISFNLVELYKLEG